MLKDIVKETGLPRSSVIEYLRILKEQGVIEKKGTKYFTVKQEKVLKEVSDWHRSMLKDLEKRGIFKDGINEQQIINFLVRHPVYYTDKKGKLMKGKMKKVGKPLVGDLVLFVERLNLITLFLLKKSYEVEVKIKLKKRKEDT